MVGPALAHVYYVVRNLRVGASPTVHRVDTLSLVAYAVLSNETGSMAMLKIELTEHGTTLVVTCVRYLPDGLTDSRSDRRPCGRV